MYIIMKKINLFKKFLSLFLIATFLGNLLIIPQSQAVSTNGAASPWTLEKAEHLAKRALISVNPQIVNDLYNAWSALWAVNILFPSVSWPDRTAYNSELETFKWPTFNPSDTNAMRKLYAFRYYRDPYEAKMKLFGLFEDIFPIDRNWVGVNDINFPDVENHFNVLSSETLGNYKNMIKKILFDTAKPENSFSMGRYLDLLNQPDKNHPNENYARELMQLFLMLEYKPWEDAETIGAMRNYTEADVAELAKIISWFRAWDDKKVYFDSMYHNTWSTISFLTGALKSWDNFSFYNSASGTIDNNLIINPINGNNGLADNTIDYIFSKRESEIADFLAWRLIKYYVKDKPNQSEIQIVASQIISNNFDIYSTVKWLLSSDMMYSDTVMNSLRYKNPLELTIGTLKLLHYKNPSVVDGLLSDTSLLSNLDWTPYNPRSIFWRDWFDNNANFMNAYFHNQWTTYASKIAFTTGTWYYDLGDIIPNTRKIENGSIQVKTSTGNTYSGSINLNNISLTLNEDIILSGSTTKTISFESGSMVFPNFYIQTASGKINIEGTLNVANNTLNISSGTLLYGTGIYTIVSSSFSINPGTSLERDITIDEMITQFEDYLYLWKRLPTGVKDEIKKYLLKTETGMDRLFLPNNITYKNKYIKAVLSMMIIEPEFILQSWFDMPETPNSSWSNPINNANSKLIMVELAGWYDWMNGIIPKSDFAYYQDIRKDLSITWSNLIDLWDVYMNKNLESLKPFFDSWELRIVNRVWAPNHSRWHDTAAIQISSQKSLQTVGTPGLIWELIKNETNPLNHIVLWSNRPPIYMNWNYINIWGSSILYKNNTYTLTNWEKTHQLTSVRNILNARTYPLTSLAVFKNSITLDDVGKNWQESVWYTLSGRLNFTKNLINNGLWITYYVSGWGWYDTHWDQLKAWTWSYNLNDRTRDLVADLTWFFNNLKATGKDVTIIVYSEFWRTLKANGTVGTDHGEWGWYFILSTNTALKTSLPNKVIWKISPEKEYEDWFGVWVDYRSIYSKILTSLYNIDVKSYFFWDYKLEDDLNTVIPTPSFLRTEIKNSYSNNMNIDLKFNVDDKNFIFKDGSYIKVYNWTDPNNLKEYSRWTIQNYTYQSDNSFKINFNLTKGTKYYYKVEIVDNQYDTYIATGSFIAPDKITDVNKNQISLSTDTYFSKYDNTIISGVQDISKIVLYNNPVETIINTGSTNTGSTNTWTTNTGTITYSWSIKDISFTGGIIMSFWTGETSISQINANSWVWNGWFILPKIIDKNEFLSDISTFSGEKLKNLNIENILKVWADTLWVGMNINRDVKISLPVKNGTGTYKVLTSENGMSWNEIQKKESITLSWNTLSFSTNHFSYFALYETTQSVIIPPVVVVPPVIVTPPIVTPPSSSWWGSWWWGGGLVKDSCPSWDFSPSYYDRTCWDKSVEIIKKDETTTSISKNKLYYQNLKKQILLQRASQKSSISPLQKLNYNGYEIYYISGYNTKDITLKILNSKIISKTNKTMYVNRINSYLQAKYNFNSASIKSRELKNKLAKQEILLKSVLNKLNK